MAWRLTDSRYPRLLAVGLVIVVALGTSAYLRALGTQFGARSVTLSDSTTGATANYQVSFVTQSTDTMGSIDVQICSNNPFPNTACDARTGLDASHVSLSSQSGATGFSVSTASTANDVILTRAPLSAPAGANSYTLSGIINPSAVGTYYIRLQAYASGDASGSATGYGGLAFAINAPANVTATVPPYLLFCSGVTIGNPDCSNVSGDYVNFGELGSTVTRQATTQLLAATNAQGGYAITVDGSTMTAGNNVIPALTHDVSRPGVSQFGLNLTANSTPAVGAALSGSGNVEPAYGQANFFRFVSGDELADSPVPAAPGLYTVSYIVNVASSQAPGDYVSTLTYVCLANF